MIVYASRTGNNRHIVSKLGLPNVEIEKGLLVNEPFFLLTYTDGLGSTPSKVVEFMKDNWRYCKGVIVSGNSNFGKAVFCKAADTLSALYGIPIIRKIELRGFNHDYEHIVKEYNKIIKGE